MLEAFEVLEEIVIVEEDFGTFIFYVFIVTLEDGIIRRIEIKVWSGLGSGYVGFVVIVVLFVEWVRVLVFWGLFIVWVENGGYFGFIGVVFEFFRLFSLSVVYLFIRLLRSLRRW